MLGVQSSGPVDHGADLRVDGDAERVLHVLRGDELERRVIAYRLVKEPSVSIVVLRVPLPG